MTVANFPVPRPGVLGAWDRIVGPGMTPGESALVLGASGLGAFFAAVRMAEFTRAGLVVAIVAAMGFDVIGGAVCNGTATTRAWYHRPGQGWREHLVFVTPHLVYVAGVAAFARGNRFDAAYALGLGLGIVAASLAIIVAPERLKSPVAFTAFLILMVATSIAFGPTPGLEWFVPALLLKLLLGHLAGPGSQPRPGSP